MLNPGAQPEGPTYIRNFDAGIFYLLQNLGSRRLELILKYDWFDPSRKAGGTQLGAAGSNLTVGDLRFDTFGAGLTWYINKQLKILGYYNHVRNELTALPGFGTDARDDVFTLRSQLRF
jgi:phosphate-selective porin